MSGSVEVAGAGAVGRGDAVPGQHVFQVARSVVQHRLYDLLGVVDFGDLQPSREVGDPLAGPPGKLPQPALLAPLILRPPL